MTRLWAACGALVVVACGAPSSPKPPTPKPQVDGFAQSRIVYADTTPRFAPRPARFTARLPITEAEANAGGAPPVGYVTHGLCHAEPDLIARLEQAIERAELCGETCRQEATELLSGAFWGCEDGPACQWAAAYVSPERGALALEIAFGALRFCSPPLRRAALTRVAPERVPLAQLATWVETGWSPDTPWEALLLRAAQTDPQTARSVGFELASTRTRESLEVLRRVRAADIPAEARNELDAALEHGLSPPQLCPDGMGCTSSPPLEVGSTLTSNCENAVVLFTEAPQPELFVEQVERRAKAAFTKHEYQWDALGCLHAWAKLDWSAARAFAASNRTVLEQRRWLGSEPIALLLRFDTRERFNHDLIETALLPQIRPQSHGVTALEILVEHHRALVLDPESGFDPVDYDHLLYAIADAASPWLDDADFEQRLPAEGDTAYTLLAYHHGKEYVVTAETESDWYDLEATYGLINDLLLDAGSPLRVVTLPDVEGLVVAEPSAVERAVRAGLLGATPAAVPPPPEPPRAVEKVGAEGASEITERLRQLVETNRRPLRPTEDLGSCRYRGSLQAVGPLRSLKGTILATQESLQPIEVELQVNGKGRGPHRAKVTWPIEADVLLDADSLSFQLRNDVPLAPGVTAAPGTPVRVTDRRGQSLHVTSVWAEPAFRLAPGVSPLQVDCAALTLHDHDVSLPLLVAFSTSTLTERGTVVLHSARDAAAAFTFSYEGLVPLTLQKDYFDPEAPWFEIAGQWPFHFSGWAKRGETQISPLESALSTHVSSYPTTSAVVTHRAPRALPLRLRPEPTAPIVALLREGARFERGKLVGGMIAISLPELVAPNPERAFYLSEPDFVASPSLSLDELNSAGAITAQ